MAEKRTANRTRNRAEPTVIDGATGALVPTGAPLRLPLKTLEHVRRYIARTIRRVEAGELPVEQGNGRVYMANALGKVIEAADIERRLDRLEQEHAKMLPGGLTQPAGD